MEVVDLKDNLWARLFMNGWKPHFVPRSLLQGLMDDGERRRHPFDNVEPADKGFIDLPGMIMLDRTHQTIKIDTFELTIPTQDFEYYYRELKDGPKRTFTSTGQEYYKIHGWIHCAVFTVEQRDLLVKTMGEMLETVKVQAKKEDDEFTRRLREINKDGVKVVSPKDPESMKGVVEKVLVSPPNNEKN